MTGFAPTLPLTRLDTQRDGQSRSALPVLTTGLTVAFYARTDEALGGDTVFLAFGSSTVIADELTGLPIKTGEWNLILPPNTATYVAARGSATLYFCAAKPDAVT